MASSACKYILCFSCGHIHEITLEQETKKKQEEKEDLRTKQTHQTSKRDHHRQGHKLKKAVH
jgi:hypothetical protein